MDDFWSQVPRHTENATFLYRKPIVLVEPNGVKHNGEQTLFTYKENGETFKQWQMMTTDSNGIIFQAWAYRAPEKYFTDNQPIAAAMFASWVID